MAVSCIWGRAVVSCGCGCHMCSSSGGDFEEGGRQPMKSPFQKNLDKIKISVKNKTK